MSRVARIVVPGYPHHVTQRGNRRADVFETEDDRHAYLRFLKKYGERHGLDIWAYCLMTNHIHLVAVPEREESLARALRDAHTVYAMRFNTRTRMSGHVWQGRFYSCVLDETHLWAAVRYVERNPVRAGMVEQAEDHPWSSARSHCGLGLTPSFAESSKRNTGSVPFEAQDALLSKEFPPPGVIEDWAGWLRVEDDPDAVDRIRRQTGTGRPCGGSRFVVQLENLLGRLLRPAKRGRKPKRAREDSGEVGNS
jgi:putative transposase